MCQFYSPIVDRNFKVYDCVEIDDSHEIIIEKYKLNDKKLKNREIVRLEVNPKDWSELTERFRQGDWDYKEDEEGTLPSWYLKNKKKIKQKVFKKLKAIYKKMFVFSGEHIIKEGRLFAYDSSKVKAYDSSQVRAYDSSKVEAWGSSQVMAYDSSKVEACDSSKVRAYDSSKVEAFNSSQVKAFNSSKVEAFNSSQVEAWGNSNIIIYSCKKITLKYNSAAIDRRKTEVRFKKAEK